MPYSVIAVCFAFILAGFPVLIAAFNNGITKTLFFWRSYEVITTYSDGSKKSDGGVESAYGETAFVAIMAVLLLATCALITIIKILYLNIKYLICLLIVKRKFIFAWSGFIPIAIFLFILVYSGTFAGLLEVILER
jgi:hypothetical protein